MARISNPVRFSNQFGIDEGSLVALGVLNPTLNLDTRLFIDPMLLQKSSHAEISNGARANYEKHFNTVIRLLRGSKTQGDAPWKAALRMLSFPEIKWTCLGYGAGSVAGSGSGRDMTKQVIRTAKQIVDLGIEDPDLFVAMALFEEGFGPDRISDMTTNVILGDLIAFNHRILDSLEIPHRKWKLKLRNGAIYRASLPRNLYVKGGAPILLVPRDILRDLPIATDWSDVAYAASRNEQLRGQVNRHIADLWQRRTLKDKKDKDELRRWAMSGKDEFNYFLSMIKDGGGRATILKTIR